MGIGFISSFLASGLRSGHAFKIAGTIAEYPATPDNFIYMCQNAL